MTSLAVKTLYSFEELRAELVQYPLAQTLPASAEFFYTLEWFENLASCGLQSNFGANVGPYLLLVIDSANGILTCLPFLAGEQVTGLSNYYSSLFGPMTWHTSVGPQTDPFADQSACNAIANQLHQAQARWPVITLSPLNTDSNFYRDIASALAQAGYWVDRFFCFGNWYLEVANRSFDAYHVKLPSHLQNSIERGKRRLTKNGEWSIHIQQSSDSLLDMTIADFVEVYDHSWKKPEPNNQFIPGLIRMAAAQGWLRLGVLRLDGRAIAAQLWFVKGTKASIYKLAYVKGFERLSVGSVLTSALMRHTIDIDRVQEVDYLTGDDAYKQDWMSHRRERWGLLAFNPRTLKGLFFAFKHFAGKFLKR